MAVKTIFKGGTEFCVEHDINVKFCVKCQAKMVKKPTINDRIMAVLADNQWHTQREIAERAALVEGDNYVDIGRDMRSLRTEECGSNPIDERRCKDNKILSEYKLLTAEEAPAFWKKREERIARLKGTETEDELRKENDELREQVKFLTEYIATLERKENTVNQTVQAAT